jgi:hypothetical protein
MLGMAERELLSMEEYARSRGVARRAIQNQVVTGVIKLFDGKVDPEQADNSWGVARRASRGIVHIHDDAGARSAKAKVAVALGRLRLAKQRVDTLRERYVDRAEAVAVGESEAVYVVDALRAAPAAYAPTLAEEMGIPPDSALRILDRFIGLTLVEIGDLPRQAKRDAERA